MFKNKSLSNYFNFSRNSKEKELALDLDQTDIKDSSSTTPPSEFHQELNGENDEEGMKVKKSLTTHSKAANAKSKTRSSSITPSKKPKKTKKEIPEKRESKLSKSVKKHTKSQSVPSLTTSGHRGANSSNTATHSLPQVPISSSKKTLERFHKEFLPIHTSAGARRLEKSLRAKPIKK